MPNEAFERFHTLQVAGNAVLKEKRTLLVICQEFEVYEYRVTDTVEPRFKELPRDWGNWFFISSVRYVEVLIFTVA